MNLEWKDLFMKEIFEMARLRLLEITRDNKTGQIQKFQGVE